MQLRWSHILFKSTCLIFRVSDRNIKHRQRNLNKKDYLQRNINHPFNIAYFLLVLPWSHWLTFPSAFQQHKRKSVTKQFLSTQLQRFWKLFLICQVQTLFLSGAVFSSRKQIFPSIIIIYFFFPVSYQYNCTWFVLQTQAGGK